VRQEAGLGVDEAREGLTVVELEVAGGFNEDVCV